MVVSGPPSKVDASIYLAMPLSIASMRVSSSNVRTPRANQTENTAATIKAARISRRLANSMALTSH